MCVRMCVSVYVYVCVCVQRVHAYDGRDLGDFCKVREIDCSLPDCQYKTLPGLYKCVPLVGCYTIPLMYCNYITTVLERNAASRLFLRQITSVETKEREKKKQTVMIPYPYRYSGNAMLYIQRVVRV